MMRKFFLTANAESLDYLIVPGLLLLVSLVVCVGTVWIFLRKPGRKKRRKRHHAHSRSRSNPGEQPSLQRGSASSMATNSNNPGDS